MGESVYMGMCTSDFYRIKTAREMEIKREDVMSRKKRRWKSKVRRLNGHKTKSVIQTWTEKIE